MQLWLTKLEEGLDVCRQIMAPELNATIPAVGQEVPAKVETLACNIELDCLLVDFAPQILKLCHQAQI